MDAGDAQAGGGELGGLVVHERDERRDDQRGAGAGDGGKLVAEGLACAGGHDKKRVATVDDSAADGFLIGAKGGEAECGVKESGEIGHAGGISFAQWFAGARHGVRGGGLSEVGS